MVASLVSKTVVSAILIEVSVRTEVVVSEHATVFVTIPSVVFSKGIAEVSVDDESEEDRIEAAAELDFSMHSIHATVSVLVLNTVVSTVLLEVSVAKEVENSEEVVSLRCKSTSKAVVV